jgi:hypothetical protein
MSCCRGTIRGEAALTCNLWVFLQKTDLSEELANWSLTRLQTWLIKVGATVVRHARSIHMGGDQTNTRINLAAKTGSRALFANQMPVQRYHGSKRLDRSAKQWLCERKDILLGECRFMDPGNYGPRKRPHYD